MVAKIGNEADIKVVRLILERVSGAEHRLGGFGEGSAFIFALPEESQS